MPSRYAFALAFAAPLFASLAACGGARFTEVVPLSTAPESVAMHAARVDACARTRDTALGTSPDRDMTYDAWRACVANANDDIVPWLQANASARGFAGMGDLFAAYRSADPICQDAVDSIPSDKAALHWDWAQEVKGIRGIDSLAACRGKREDVLATLIDTTLDLTRVVEASREGTMWTVDIAMKSMVGNIAVATGRDEDDVTRTVAAHVQAVLDGGKTACQGISRVRADFSSGSAVAQTDRCAATVGDLTAQLLRGYDVSQVLTPTASKP
jgi:hypothetical protein